MNLYLVASVLLLVPSVFAGLRVTPAKFVYSDGYVLSDSGYGSLSYHLNDSYLSFDLKEFNHSPNPQASLLLSNGKPPLSFVAEFVADLGAQEVETGEFCQGESDPELKPLIVSCRGLVKLRKPNDKETKQIEAFKRNTKKNGGHKLYMQYDSLERLVSRTWGLEWVDLEFPLGKGFMSVIGYNFSDNFYSSARIGNFIEKKFAVEGLVREDNCRHPPVEGLQVMLPCAQVQISNPSVKDLADGLYDDSDDDSDDENEGTAPAKPSLDALTPEQLKELLKEILGRL